MRLSARPQAGFDAMMIRPLPLLLCCAVAALPAGLGIVVGDAGEWPGQGDRVARDAVAVASAWHAFGSGRAIEGAMFERFAVRPDLTWTAPAPLVAQPALQRVATRPLWWALAAVAEGPRAPADWPELSLAEAAASRGNSEWPALTGVAAAAHHDRSDPEPVSAIIPALRLPSQAGLEWVGADGGLGVRPVMTLGVQAWEADRLRTDLQLGVGFELLRSTDDASLRALFEYYEGPWSHGFEASSDQRYYGVSFSLRF